MRKVFLPILLVLFCSCTNKNRGLPHVSKDIAPSAIKANPAEMLYSQTRFLAADFVGDTIAHKPGGKQMLRASADTIIPRQDITVIIDTSYQVYSKECIYRWIEQIKVYPGDFVKYGDESKIPDIKRYYSDLDAQRKKTVVQLPVLIYNHGKNAAYVEHSYGSDFKMIQEALDIDGKWKPIEFYFSGMGGCIPMPTYFIKIRPKHYLAMSTIKYHGDFKTKIRVKLRSNNDLYYSNPVTGYINRSQFNHEKGVVFRMTNSGWPIEDPTEEDFREIKRMIFLDW